MAASNTSNAKTSKLKKIKWVTFSLMMILNLTVVESVKQGDFKRWDQCGFYKRNKQYRERIGDNPLLSPYSIVQDSLRLHDSQLEADIINTKNNVLFTLQVKALEIGGINIRVNEKSPLRPRYEQARKYSLTKEPALKKQSLIKGEKLPTNYKLDLTPDGTQSVIIQYEPFKLDVFSNGKPLLTINERGFFNFEHQRLKAPPKDEFVAQNEGNNENIPDDNANQDSAANDNSQDQAATSGEEQKQQEEEEIDFWEESFNGHMDSKPYGPTSIGVDITFHNFEHVYGIPEHASSLSLKTTNGEEGGYSEPYRLYNLDVFEYIVDSPMALYGSIPFMASHRPRQSAGVFWLNSAEMWVDIAKQSSPNPMVHTHWISESGIVDLFVFMEDNPKGILKQYGELTGFTALPPAFSLGYHQCRWNYLSQSDVEEVNKGFDHYDIPYDVIWLDIEHTVGKRYFTWDLEKFPDPVTMQNNLAITGRKVVTIVDPHIKRDDEFIIHKEGQEKGLYIKDTNGNDYEGWCWPGSSSWIDYTREDAREWWISKFAFDQYNYSTEHLYIWNDMNEPSVFNGPEITMLKDRVHDGGWEHRELHNMFGLLFHQSTALGLVKRMTPNRRPFVLSRAFFPGTQRVSAIWTGDNEASWEHLSATVPMLLTIGLAGISFSGADVGGFFGNPDIELLVRWYQSGAFQPFFRGHAHIDTKRRELWVFGEPYTSYIREAIRTRYALLPYWYTLFFESNMNGVPAMRPMFLEFPDDPLTLDIDDQHMVGSALLVKPIVAPNTFSTEVYFPGTETWYDYFHFQAYVPGRKHTVNAALDAIPVFVKGGSIIPQQKRIRRSYGLMQLDPITLFVVLDSKGQAQGELYMDDGESYQYLKGGYIHQRYQYQNGQLTSQSIPIMKLENPLPFEPTVATLDQPISDAIRQYLEGVVIERISVLGLQQPPQSIFLGETALRHSFDATNKVLTIKHPNLKVTDEWTLLLK